MRLIIALLFCSSMLAQVYPGAVGWGSQWSFPSNYEVYIVDTLSDTPSAGNTFREAIEDPVSADARIVVFNGLSGTIETNSPIQWTQDNKGLYIAGQTSENGILLKLASGTTHDVLIVSGDRFIMRQITVAPGIPHLTDQDRDGIVLRGPNNVLIDQVTSVWATDGVLDIGIGRGSKSGVTTSNVTVQRSIISEVIYLPSGWAGVGGKAMAISGADRVSLYRNLLAHNDTRNPLMGGGDNVDGTGGTSGDEYELVQNVLYNYGAIAMVHAQTDIGQNGNPVSANISWINNYVRQGSNSSTGRRPLAIEDYSAYPSVDVVGYIDDNFDEIWRTLDADPQQDILGLGTGSQAAIPAIYTFTPFGYPLDGTTRLTKAQLEDLPNGMGDPHDIGGLNSAITSSYEDGTGNGEINAPSESTLGGYPTIAAGTIITDVNRNGIPDSLEGQWGNDTWGYVAFVADGGTPPPTQTPAAGNSKKETSAMLIAH